MRIFSKVDSFGDEKLTLKRTPPRDAFWFRLSKLADHSAIWFVLGIIQFAIFRNIRDFIIFIAAIAIESGLTNGPIKFMFKRKRPHEIENTFNKEEKLPYGMRRPITSSFPSGHATAGMCAAILLGFKQPLFLIGLIPLALLVGYSRMYTRMHHLSDVFCGFILGGIYAFIVIVSLY